MVVNVEVSETNAEDVAQQKEDDFVNEDYIVEHDDEEFVEIADKQKDSTGHGGRPKNNPVKVRSTFQIDVPSKGDYVKDSKYNDESKLHSNNDGSSDEDDHINSVIEPEFHVVKEMDNPYFVKGLKFKNFVELKKAVKN